MSNRMRDCYDSLNKLWQFYDNSTKKLIWTSDKEKKFLFSYLDHEKCVSDIIDYLVTIKEEINVSPAKKEEYNMLYVMLEKYTNEMKQKVDKIKPRIDAKRTTQLMAIDKYFTKTDPKYSSNYFVAALPSAPTNKISGGKTKKPRKTKKKEKAVAN
jgi:hypothetical protein